jgi:adenosylcobinamide kinase/adenosylcobinamide-phosphate guanylyltransferase
VGGGIMCLYLSLNERAVTLFLPLTQKSCTFAFIKTSSKPMRRIILITGGARSGKSTYAEKLALSLSPTPVYLATARIWDEEFRKRVIHHQERRGPEWTNIEEDKELSRHSLSGRTVLIDCITLWCTNFFFDLDADTDRSLAAAKAEFDRFTAQDATFIFVTNEIGMGGTSENEIQRKFTDMQGWMNQYVASRADEVILMVSGIATKIKCE